MTDDIVVSREWLAAHRDEVRIVDVRDAWEYDGIGHIPGAVNVPFDRFRSESEETAGMLPGADAFADLMSEAGIAPADTVVAYDDTHGVFAARFLVTAQVYGHDDVRLLDGDYSAWNLEHATTTDAPAVEPTDYVADPPADSILVDHEAVREAMDADAVLVDTRDDWEYEEGHIPGAVNLDWKELVDDETRGLKPREELETVLDSYGITPDRRVVLYCNTARRISHTYVVLRHLGYEDVAFYEGSLTEWTDVGGPVESGS
ncbi:sulfurtransferase [Halostella salina]|uniref:sulfurtransferase n=1 Tax=Halostella salina TaxID=1547897 RepID=UPI000EF80656|nr:sulfurtransferase [Halostella salina]